MSIGRFLLTSASIAGIALPLISLFIRPIPLVVFVLTFTILSVLIVTGVHMPHLQMFVKTTWHGRRDSTTVSLTFDDGPHPLHTRQVLDILDAAGARATFFVVGCKVAAHPDVAAEIVRRGHEIGVHSFTHDRLLALRGTKKISHELLCAIETVRKATGITASLFRPPVGVTSPPIAVVTRNLGLDVVSWSVRARDGIASAEPDEVAARVIRKIQPGDIVLLHDAAERDDRVPASILALPRILTHLQARGLQAVTVSACAFGPPSNVNGELIQNP